MTTPSILERPERTRAHSRWGQLTRREKAHACWLALRAGWRDINIPNATCYDTDSDVVLVEFRAGDQRSAATWSVVKWAPDETLARIEAAFGVEARKRAEEACG